MNCCDLVSFVWQARKDILKIHTRQWTPPPSDTFLEELADKCVGMFVYNNAKMVLSSNLKHEHLSNFPSSYNSCILYVHSDRLHKVLPTHNYTLYMYSYNH